MCIRDRVIALISGVAASSFSSHSSVTYTYTHHSGNGTSQLLNKQNSDDLDKIVIIGTVTSTSSPYPDDSDYICTVKVDKIVSFISNYGGEPTCHVGDEVGVYYGAYGEDTNCGTYDQVKTGDEVKVYGVDLLICGSPVWNTVISICGKSSYYLKKIGSSSNPLSIYVYTDKSEYKLNEPITIHYGTNKECSATLTITHQDGAQTKYGPDNINGRYSKTFIAEAPLGGYTVDFAVRALDNNERQQDTCYYYIIPEAYDVKFQGQITNIFNKYDPHYYDANIKVTKIINDPSGTLYVGKTVTVKRTNEDAYEDEVEIGDQVEVNAGYDSRYSYYSVGRWQDYIKKLEIPSETTVKFRGAIKNTFNKLSDYWYDADITVTEILDDPSGSLYIGKTVTIKRTSGDACEDPVNIGDEVQVYAVCKNDHYSIRKYEHYIKKLIEGERSDLIIQDISWSPADPKIGNTIEFWITVKNQGIDSAEKFNVVGDMCEPIKKSKGIPFRFFDFDVPSLAAGEEYTYTATYKPEIRGEYYLEVVADNWHEIKEIEENNNKVKVSFTVSDKPKEVKFIGTYLYVFNPMGFNAYHFSVDKVLEGKDIAGDKTQIIISEVRETPEAIKELKEGDKVEIYGKVKNYYEGAWIIDIEGNGYYIKGKPKGKQEIKFIGTFEYSRSIWNGGAQQYFFSVDKILRGNGITCSQADIVIPVREPNEKLDAISQILKTLKKGDKVLIYAELKSQVMICDLGFSSDKHFVHRYSTDLNTQYLEQVGLIFQNAITNSLKHP